MRTFILVLLVAASMMVACEKEQTLSNNLWEVKQSFVPEGEDSIRTFDYVTISKYDIALNDFVEPDGRPKNLIYYYYAYEELNFWQKLEPHMVEYLDSMLRVQGKTWADLNMRGKYTLHDAELEYTSLYINELGDYKFNSGTTMNGLNANARVIRIHGTGRDLNE